jgi:hypothetical protein
MCSVFTVRSIGSSSQWSPSVANILLKTTYPLLTNGARNTDHPVVRALEMPVRHNGKRPLAVIVFGQLLKWVRVCLDRLVTRYRSGNVITRLFGPRFRPVGALVAHGVGVYARISVSDWLW